MSLSRQEVQRIIDRVSKLESQVGNMVYKLNAIETLLKPENLIRRVREGENEEKRKLEREQFMSATDPVAPPKAPG